MLTKCSFCGQDVREGTGKLFVRSDGSQSLFCSRKCERNAVMKREPSKTKWTATWEKIKKHEE